MPVMRRLNVGGTTYDTVGEASVTQVLSSGTKIATVSIDGTSTDIYAPSGGSSVEPATANPGMDGTAAVGSSAKYAREDHVHPSDTSKLSGVILNTSAEPYSVPVANSSATIDIGDGLSVSDSNNKITLKAKTGTTSGTVATGNHTHSDYQATLVSGTNIKTINGDSILGSGNLTVGGDPTPMTAQEVAAAVESGWADIPIVTVSLTNPYNPSHFNSCSVMETDLANTYAPLGYIDSPTGSRTFQMSGDYPYLQVFVEGLSVGGGTATCIGGVTFYSNPESGIFNMQVTADGTVTIDGVDYDD